MELTVESYGCGHNPRQGSGRLESSATTADELEQGCDTCFVEEVTNSLDVSLNPRQRSGTDFKAPGTDTKRDKVQDTPDWPQLGLSPPCLMTSSRSTIVDCVNVAMNTFGVELKAAMKFSKDQVYFLVRKAADSLLGKETL